MAIHIIIAIFTTLMAFRHSSFKDTVTVSFTSFTIYLLNVANCT